MTLAERIRWAPGDVEITHPSESGKPSEAAEASFDPTQLLFEDFDPDKHPRDEHGRFSSGGGGGSSGSFGEQMRRDIGALPIYQMGDKWSYSEAGIREIGAKVLSEYEQRVAPFRAEKNRLQEEVSRLTDSFAERNTKVFAVNREIGELHDRLQAWQNVRPDQSEETQSHAREMVSKLSDQMRGKIAELDQAIAERATLESQATVAFEKFNDQIAAQEGHERATLIQTLSEIRPMGFAAGSPTPMYNATSDPKAVQAIEQTYDQFPRDWMERSRADGETRAIRAITQGLPMGSQDTGRGYYSHGGSSELIAPVLSIGSNSNPVRVATHEMGHRFESVVPGVVEVERQFYERRTPEALRPLGAGYDSSEVTRPDRFVDPYMGKSYEPVDWNESGTLLDHGHQRSQNYELLSMGLESVYHHSYAIEKDPEYNHLILGMLATL